MLDLDTIARGATDAVAGQQPPTADLADRVNARKRRRQAFATTGLVVGAFVLVLGGWAMTRSSSASPLATDEGAVGLHPLAGPNPSSPWNVVVFLVAEASPGETANVEQILVQSDSVSDFVFVSKAETFSEFQEFFADDKELLDTIELSTMPTSFRAAVDDLDDPLLGQLIEQAGVRTIIGPDGVLPEPITVYGSPIFDRPASVQLFLASRAGYDEAFRRCMAEKGFDSQELASGAGFWPEDYVDAIESSSDLEYAQDWGFAVVTVDQAPVPRPADPQIDFDEDDPYYKAAFGGLFGDGCSGEANDAWSGGERTLNQAWDSVEGTQRKFAADLRVIEHYAEWSKCMAGKGRAASSPFDAYDQIVQSFVAWKTGDLITREDMLKARERDLAVATVECGASSSHLVSLQLAQVWNEYAEGGWDENRYRANHADCQIESQMISAELLAELATLDEQNADVERCFGE